ncbi:MAG: hypothetical protein CBC11_005145 [Proteobacteria bacterium TMED51]|jgi:drug/metabolite transporter (DMT)-like permease|nr:MAG: hypothetical protein CND88_00895 [Candidatus Thioglobus sp. MED-G23]RPG01116.1 MAG: hypothetical protein CBC11_005145 [Proteobacteria bacterium TMED51]HBP83945.1 hypothetical protein [Gammaproteobacteria bacterium]|tara:strand:+ start:1266 stop:1796 length:531 start_codon:yes stop_codon:yes gene_type:complete
MNAWMLLLLITLMYAGYNLFVKVSGDHAAGTVTTTILATISLQTAALVVSLIFAAYLFIRGGQTFAIPPASYKWAVLSGICIGIAEIGYFYLFSGTGLRQTIPASTAIPVIVCGTVVIAFIYCVCGFSERAIRLAPDAGRGFGSAWRRRPLYQVGISLAHTGRSVRPLWQLSVRER